MDSLKEALLKLIEIQVRQNRAIYQLNKAGAEVRDFVENDMAESLFLFLGYSEVSDSMLDYFSKMMDFYILDTSRSSEQCAQAIYDDLVMIKRGQDRELGNIEKLYGDLLEELNLNNIKKSGSK